MIEQLFFEIIQVAIGTRICLSHTPSADEWGELYAIAKKQSLVGICFAGLQHLTTNHPSLIINLSELLRLKWMGMAAKIQQRNEVVIVMRGSGCEIEYDSEGRELQRVEMVADSACSGVVVPRGAWHAFIAHEDGTTIFEAKDGAYDPVTTEEFL